jgi:hypothetical protein
LQRLPPEHNRDVGSARVAPNVWSGSALAGLLLAALVWAVWPEPASPMQPAAEPPPPALVVTEDAGPPPVASEAELEPGYVEESPEELGAEPLPGAELTPEPPPVAG